MHTIKDSFTNKLIVSKSIFITSIFSVDTVDEANIIIKEIKKKYYDANHNCYAYILGSEQNIQKASDDGEPSKTAGFPMLNVLKKRGMSNILAITTRYFGGVKLGAGGLIRVYGTSVSEVLEKATIYHTEIQTKLKLFLDYSTYNQFIANNYDLTVIESVFTEKVTLILGIKKDFLEAFKEDLNNLLLGNKMYNILEDFNVLVKD